VDGSHRFHEVFVDLYFLRGIVDLEDSSCWTTTGGHRSAPAERYFELDLGWRAVPGALGGCGRCGCPTLVRAGVRGLPDVLTR
jgi:hypothetical protein